MTAGSPGAGSRPRSSGHIGQLSLFSADLAEPRPEDLGGLLAAHGQVARGRDGARLSILLSHRWRADALLRECRVRDIPAEVVAVGEGGAVRARREAADAARAPFGERPDAPLLLRTAPTSELATLADAWTRGAVKAVPQGLTLGAGLLRCWTLAAGRPAEPGTGYLLGVDPHAEQTHEPLAAACSRAGVAGSILGVRAGGPAIRVVGHRRLMRLVELLGTPPPDAPAGSFPTPGR